MSQVVQSLCPGCKKRLRIPSDWLQQAIRCKHCGTVLQAKDRAAPAASERASAPSIQKAVATTNPSPAQAAASLAVPVAQPVSGPAFADFDHGERQTNRRAKLRQPKGGGSGWMGAFLALLMLVLTAGGVFFFWDNLAALFPPDDEVVDNSTTNDAGPKPRKNSSASSDEPSTTKDKTPPKSGSAKNPAKNDPTPKDTSRPPRSGGSIFPRRALVISIHDYLYANPILNGSSKSDNFHAFLDNLSRAVQIPRNQIAHLSDDSFHTDGDPRAPTKAVIEKTLTNFLDTSRAQDRIVVFFVGHSVELGDDVYLAPIEGELERAETLIPLKWFYEQLAKCKARQKVLVLDINRFNPTIGQERPGGDEMGEKLDAMLKAPPNGVQVWSSCIAKQRSYASDEYPMGVFLDSMRETAGSLGSGKIQNDPKKSLPLERWVELVNQRMKSELSKRKLEQVSRLTGKEAEDNDAYDPKEAPPPNPVTALAAPPSNVTINKMLIESVLSQAGAPPIKVTHELAIRYDALPPFSVDALKKYQGDVPNPESPLRKAVKNARAVLWAVYPAQEPKDLSADVSVLRSKIGVQLNVLRDGYRAPVGGGNVENQFKSRVENDERRVALIMRYIDDALNDLRDPKVVEARESESKRWQANYDYIHARVQLEYAYLFEYQSMLGSMRKEFPPRDPELQSGWKLASQSKLQGDSAGKKFAKDGHKLLDKIIKDHAGSPWEVLAKREKLTNLGLEWQATR
jgi:hypothetical protein